jgi:uncharacterized protein (TIGR02145 family)
MKPRSITICLVVLTMTFGAMQSLRSQQSTILTFTGKNTVTGAGYGNEVSFATQTDGSGGTVTIGSQLWMLSNLDVTTYRNGDTIPQVTDAAAWAGLTTGAWCYYNNDPATGAIYGKLYNWYAVNDPRGLAPAGWRVPTDIEWKTLEMSLGMTQMQADVTGYMGTDQGGQLKEADTTHWISPNAGATNSSGFTALSGGYRYIDGAFNYAGKYGNWWSSTEYSATIAWSRGLFYKNTGVYRYNVNKKEGSSVRCIRD